MICFDFPAPNSAEYNDIETNPKTQYKFNAYDKIQTNVLLEPLPSGETVRYCYHLILSIVFIFTITRNDELTDLLFFENLSKKLFC